jgi:putative ABC transport system permease protein
MTRFGGLARIAWRNVLHSPRRSLSAIVGMSSSLTLVLLQLGFLNAVRVTSTNLFDRLDFDLVLTAPTYDTMYDTGFLPRERLTQAASVPGVVGASPLWLTFGQWRCPPYPLISGTESEPPGRPWLDRTRDRLSGRYVPRPLKRRQLLVIGIEPENQPFLRPTRDAIEAAGEDLKLDCRVLLDSQSHPDFGWDLWPAFTGWELDRAAVEVVGGFDMPRGFGADGAIVTSRGTFLRHCPWPSPDLISLGLLRVRPGMAEQALAALKKVLPPDVRVLAREPFCEREREHWVSQTTTGQIFAIGVLVAMIVAAVIVYQVISNDVRTRMPEYATLKALGHGESAPAQIVVVQSLILSTISYAPAVLFAWGLYWLTEALATIPMVLTTENLVLTLLLALGVGLVVSFFTARKLRWADPADLF